MKRIVFISVSLLMLGSLSYSQSLDELFEKTDNYYEASFYEKALETADKALIKAEADFGKNSSKYAIALDKRARLHWINGEYEKALGMYKKALDIIKDNSGEKNKDYTTVLLDLARLYSSMDMYKDAENTFKKVIELRKTVLGEKYPDYIDALDRFAGMYLDYEHVNKAQQVYEEAYRLIKEYPDDNNISYTLLMMNLTMVYEETYNYEKAVPVVKHILQITEKVSGKDHQDYQRTLNQLARLYYKMGLYDETEPVILDAIALISGQINKSFYDLSEYYKGITLGILLDNDGLYYSYGLQRMKENKNILKDLVNLRIATKGMILTSVSGARRRICSSNDISVSSNYDSLTALKSVIASAYTMTPEERKQKGINIKELESKANQLETQIIYLSDLYKKEVESRDIKYEDLRNSLEPDEAVIDYINFDLVGKDSDTIKDTLSENVYAAFIIKAGDEAPEFVKLCGAKDIEKYISSETDENIYVKNNVESNKLFKLIWQPIEKYLGGVNKVYISPSGALSRVSFAVLASDEQTLLIDKYKIKYTVSLKEIVDTKKSGKDKSAKINNAYIFGGIKYDIDSAVMVTNAMKSRGGDNRDGGNTEGDNTIVNSGTYMKDIIIEQQVRSGWGYLKGTMEEAEKISVIMSRNGYQNKILSGEEGTEEAFKSLNGANSPSIIHLSTHGFFFPDPNPNKYYIDEGKEKKPNTARGLYKSSVNPLFRSGLILSGANRIWKDNKKIEGIEDGILTAYEVSNMDFANTELAVLSACETGLGDVHGGEGVFGLQRAFKIAGVKNVIMSLWKVPDRETSELMEMFYTNLIEKKMNIDDAFYSAQKKMRQKYADPYFWAAFILM